MQDIRMHSDNELSLLVFNDEWLYCQRRRRDFIDLIKECFLFSNEQLEILENDLNEENE